MQLCYKTPLKETVFHISDSNLFFGSIILMFSLFKANFILEYYFSRSVTFSPI